MALSNDTREMAERMANAYATSTPPSPENVPVNNTPVHTRIAQAVLENITMIATLDIRFDENTRTFTSDDPRLKETLETAQQGTQAIGKRQAMKEILELKKILAETYQLKTGDTTPQRLVMARRPEAIGQALSAHKPTPKTQTFNPKYTH